jgi:hypothetical protein
MSTLVQSWFGSAFDELHPRLQQLHRHGGVLAGKVEVRYGSGMGGVLGRRLARRLNIAASGTMNELEVTIASDHLGLHWNRRFNRGAEFKSLFVPVGRYPSGHWVERSGAVQLELGVDIVNRGWHWRQRAISVSGIRIPAALAPRTTAFKEIEAEDYRFHVEIGLPAVGMLLSYSGVLVLTANAHPTISSESLQTHPERS